MQRRRATRGEVNIVTFIVLGAILFAVWWLWLWSPLALDQIDVKQAVAEAVNTAANNGLETARFRLVQKLNHDIGWHYEIDEVTNQEVKRPGLGIEPKEIVLVKNEESKDWECSVSYVRTIRLVPFNMRRNFQYQASARTPIR